MLTFLTLVNDREQYARCKESLGPPAEDAREFVVVEPNARGWNAAQGLNHGLDACKTDWVVCVHQDVLFGRGWISRMTALLPSLPASVAVVGVVGTRADGRFRGHILDPNGHCYWGPLPAEVLVLDESVLVLRRASGLRFDEQVPGFHCYGADLCLQARAQGLKVMAVDAPVRHLSTGRLDDAYHRAASWLLERWGKPFGYLIPTPAANMQDPERSRAWRRLLFRWRRRQDRLIRNQVPPHARLDATP